MVSDPFLFTSVAKGKGNYDTAITILTELIRDNNGSSNKDALILLYKERAECHYKLKHFDDTVNDILCTIHEGFAIEDSEKYLYMFK